VRTDTLHWIAIASLVALIALCVAWELYLAPLRPGGSWLVLKALPLLVPLPGILRGRLYTYRWAPMLVLAYFTEGVVRAATDPPPASLLAAAEVALALLFIASASLCARRSATRRAHRDPDRLTPAG
jgi:uncharacterized membrane protein